MWFTGVATSSPASAQAEQGSAGAETTKAEQDREARFLFEAARSAYDAGRYEDALTSFQRAYELSQRPALLYNVGQAADRLRKDEIALDAFERYVQALPDAENRPAVEERIRVLRAVLAEKRAAAQAAPSPMQAAQAAPPPSNATAPAGARTTQDERKDEGGLLTKWWLWAGAGGVVAAVVVTALIASSGDGASTQGMLVSGTDGKVITAAGWRR
jgi:tetratricopeptide (TPR) repeat protein